MPVGSVLKPHVEEKRIASWEQLYDEYLALGTDVTKWIFRGQKDVTWGLETSLERVVRRFGWELTESPDIEKGLIRRFKRQLHHYSKDTPSPGLEWLALMQHYGAPTRLQDWTYSFFVAVYFAIEQADKAAGVWALDRSVVNSTLTATLTSDAKKCLDDSGYIDSQECFDTIFNRKPPLDLVVPVNPLRLNERLVIQQGLFLCPGNVSASLEENIAAVLPSPGHGALVLFVIENSATTRRSILWHLNRMNMNTATLFPGLDGFARSLATLVAWPKLIPPGKE